MAESAVSGTEQPTLVAQAQELAAKYVPGLGSLAPKTAAKPKRSRNKAKSSAVTLPAGDTDVGGSLPSDNKSSGLKLEGLSEQPLDLPARTPASVIIAKRLKATSKKLQRIEGYTGDNLNADQQRAVASKPGLELVQKELQEIVKVLETDEAEVEKDTSTRAAHEDKRTQSRVAQAIAQTKENSKSDLSLLFQFLHLSSLFSPNQGFNPPELPAVVQNATGQEAAAVRMLANEFQNGPLMGGGEDAFERLDKLQSGREEELVEGVTYGRVKQMILDLTAAPEELTAEDHEVAPETQTNGVDSLTPEQEDTAQQAHAALTSNNGPALTFMQASELDSAPVEQPVESVQVIEQPVSEATWGEPQTVTAPSNTNEWATTTEQPQSGGAKPISSWADEVDEATAPDRAPLAPVVELQPTAPIPVSDPVMGSELETTPVVAGRGRGGRGSRGAPRGERSDRGRGEHRERRDGQGRGGYRNDRPPRTQEPVEEGWARVEKKHDDGPSRGRGRGGRGRGEGRGRGPRPEGERRPQAPREQSNPAPAS